MSWNEWKFDFPIVNFWVMVDFVLKNHGKIDQFCVQKWPYLKSWNLENRFFICFNTSTHYLSCKFEQFWNFEKKFVHEFIHLAKKKIGGRLGPHSNLQFTKKIVRWYPNIFKIFQICWDAAASRTANENAWNAGTFLCETVLNKSRGLRGVLALTGAPASPTANGVKHFFEMGEKIWGTYHLPHWGSSCARVGVPSQCP